jgi:hypothetical protein
VPVPEEPLVPCEALLLCFLLFLVVEVPLLWSPICCEPPELAPLDPDPDVLPDPLVPLWPLVPVDWACTATALHSAATTDTLIKPFKSLFIFMSIS